MALVIVVMLLIFSKYGHFTDIICGSGPSVCTESEYRPFDGSCSTPKYPKCGSNGSLYGRLMPGRHNGRHGFPLTTTGEQFPNARNISTFLFPNRETIDKRYTLSAMEYGQLVTHDLSFTQANAAPVSCCSEDMHFIPPPKTYECASINVTDDPFYKKYQATCVSMFRTETNRKNNCSLNTRYDEPLTEVPGTLDLHILYSTFSGNNLRSYKSGLLITRNHSNQEWFPICDEDSLLCSSALKRGICYWSGDPRTNQNTNLVVLELLFLRQHNSIARKLVGLNPHWNDDRLYQETRKIIMAIHQHITYYELLPIYMGKEYLYSNKILYETRGFVNDYDENVCPAVVNEFAHGAFRHFHAMILDRLNLISNDRVHLGNISLKNWYDNPKIVEENFDELAIGLHTQSSGAADINYVPEIKNQLFQNYKECGLDLRAIDIQRGRDHNLPSYNTMRGYCGLKKAKTFEDFSDYIAKQRIKKLQKIYKNVEDVELVVGGSYENPVPEALVGPVFLCIMREQFYRTRVGDPYWYEGKGCGFTLEQLMEIRKASMAMIVCNYGFNITKMQPKAFLSISFSNPLLPCSKIPQIDLNKWQDYSSR